MNSIKIEIPSLGENIRIIESFIDNAKEKYLIDDDIYGNIMIAVTESVNNAIRHGNSGETTKNVFLSLNLYDNMVEFVVEDQGQGFDYQNLPDPTAPENLGKPGGRGIFLMKNLADEVKFKEQGRIVELCFYIDK
ncbi:MAG: ATP-binding protein [Cyclobacteriaceae bacterium]